MKQQRAFTLVVVLVVVVLAAAVVAGVLSALRSQTVSAIRSREEAAARGIAEACADRMFAYATTFIRDSTEVSGEPPLDFDALLDPDGTPNSGDEFMPSGGALVSVPPNANNPMTRHAAFRLDGGACLIRFDDNSDDWHPGLGSRSHFTNVVEGPAAGDEVVFRDRDRSIWVSVIGVFPAFAETPNADLWTRAHARVSIRRFLETAGGPAVWAGDEITVADGGLAVCGLGGMEAEDFRGASSTNLCACGHQKAADTADAIVNECNYTSGSGDMCDDPTRACEPNLREAGTQRKPGPIDLPRESTFQRVPRTDFVKPQVDAANPGSCAVWIRDSDAPDPAKPPNASGQRPSYRSDSVKGLPEGDTTITEGVAYIWANDTKRAEARPLLSQLLTGNGECDSLMGATRVACNNALTQDELCPDTFAAGATMPAPCRWDLDSSSFAFNTGITCEVGESRCWVPIAVLDGVHRDILQERTGGILGSVETLLGPLKPLLSLVSVLTLGAVSADDVVQKLAAGLVSGAVGIGEQSIKDTDGKEKLAFRKSTPTLDVDVGLVKLKVSGSPPTLKISILSTTLINSPLLGGILGPVVTNALSSGSAVSIETFCGGGCTGNNECVGEPSFFFLPDSSLGSERALQDQRNLPRNMNFIVENGRKPGGGTPVWSPLRLQSATKTGSPANDAAGPIRIGVQASGDIIMTEAMELCCPTCTCPNDDNATAGTSVTTPNPRRRSPNAAPNAAGRDCDAIAANLFVPESSFEGRHTLLQSDGNCVLDGRSMLIGAVKCSNISVRQTQPSLVSREAGGCFIGGLDGRAMCGDVPCDAPELNDPTLVTGCIDGNGGPRVDRCTDPGVCLPRSLGVVGNVRSATDVCIGDHVTVFGQVIAFDDVALQRAVVVNHSNAGSIGAVTQAQAWVEGTP